MAKNDLKQCNQCGHRWFSRVEGRPGTCPQCRSTVWDQPKKENANAEAE